MILTTGAEGFLLSNLLKELDIENVDHLNIKELDKFNPNNYDKITEVYHFAFPSSSDEWEEKLTKSLDQSLSFVRSFENFQDSKNVKFIFASSMAVDELIKTQKFDSNNFQDLYAGYKAILEYAVTTIFDDVIILRIPRVYGKDRNKGLLKKLREGTFIGDKTKVIEYMDINDWVSETKDFLKNHKSPSISFPEYKNTQIKTIEEIERIYV